MQNSLYFIADSGNKETDPVSLGFANAKSVPENGGSGGTGGDGSEGPTPIPSSGDATVFSPFTAQFKDAKIKLSAFGLISLYHWQIKLQAPTTN
jgi:hypothetical protein